MPTSRAPHPLTPDDLVWTFGDRIAKVRKLTGLHQADIAALCHVDRKTVALWEGGHHAPPRTKRRAYAEAIEAGTGAPAHWILEGSLPGT